MKKRGFLRNATEFALARSVLAIAGRLPQSLIPKLAGLLGTILDLVLKGRRRVVFENLKLAYGTSAEAPDPRKISRGAFANLCLSFLDLVRVPKDPERFLRHIRWRRPEDEGKVRALLKEGPIVFATCHYGAYEVMAMWSGAGGIDLTSLVRPLDNPYLEAFLLRCRTRFGQKIANNRGGARDLARTLEAGGSVGILADLNMKGDRRVFVDFFGVKAATATTVPRLARRHHCPVVPLFCHRTERALDFELEIGTIIPASTEPVLDADADDLRILQSVTDDIERLVRAKPQDWLWTHRRWKTRPPSESA